MYAWKSFAAFLSRLGRDKKFSNKGVGISNPKVYPNSNIGPNVNTNKIYAKKKSDASDTKLECKTIEHIIYH